MTSELAEQPTKLIIRSGQLIGLFPVDHLIDRAVRPSLETIARRTKHKPQLVEVGISPVIHELEHPEALKSETPSIQDALVLARLRAIIVNFSSLPKQNQDQLVARKKRKQQSSIRQPEERPRKKRGSVVMAMREDLLQALNRPDVNRRRLTQMARLIDQAHSQILDQREITIDLPQSSQAFGQDIPPVSSRFVVVDPHGQLTIRSDNEPGPLIQHSNQPPIVIISHTSGDIASIESMAIAFSSLGRSVIVISPPNSRTGTINEQWLEAQVQSPGFEIDAEYFKRAIGMIYGQDEPIDIVGYSMSPAIIETMLTDPDFAGRVRNSAMMMGGISPSILSKKPETKQLKDPLTYGQFTLPYDLKTDIEGSETNNSRLKRILSNLKRRFKSPNEVANWIKTYKLIRQHPFSPAKTESGRRVYINGLADHYSNSVRHQHQQQQTGDLVINIEAGVHIDPIRRPFQSANIILEAWSQSSRVGVETHRPLPQEDTADFIDKAIPPSQK